MTSDADRGFCPHCGRLLEAHRLCRACRAGESVSRHAVDDSRAGGRA